MVAHWTRVLAFVISPVSCQGDLDMIQNTGNRVGSYSIATHQVRCCTGLTKHIHKKCCFNLSYSMLCRCLQVTVMVRAYSNEVLFATH